MTIDCIYAYNNFELTGYPTPEGRVYYKSDNLKSLDYKRYANAINTRAQGDKVGFVAVVIIDDDLSLIHSRILESPIVNVIIHPDHSVFYLKIKGSSRRVPEEISRLVEKYLLDYMSIMELYIINKIICPEVYKFNSGVLEFTKIGGSPSEVLKYSRVNELTISDYDDLIYLHQDIYFRNLVFDGVTMGDVVDLDYYLPEVRNLIVRSNGYLNLTMIQSLISLEIRDYSYVAIRSKIVTNALKVVDSEVLLLGDDNIINYLELSSVSKLLGVRSLRVRKLVLNKFQMYDRMPMIDCTRASLELMTTDSKVLDRITTEHLQVGCCEIPCISDLLRLPSKSLEIINSKDSSIINEIVGEVHPRLELILSYLDSTENNVLIKNSEFNNLHLVGTKDILMDLCLSEVKSSDVNIKNFSVRINHLSSNDLTLECKEDANHSNYVSDSIISNLQVGASNCAISITNCIVGTMVSPTISKFIYSKVDELNVPNDDSTLSLVNSKIGTLKILGSYVDFVIKKDSEIDLMIVDSHSMAVTYDDTPLDSDKIKVSKLHLILNWYMSSPRKNFGYMRILDSLQVTNELVLYIHEGVRHIYTYRKFSEFINPDCLIITSKSAYNLLMKKHVIDSSTKVKIISNNELKKTLGI